jgi:hypothetical protein
MVVVPVLAGGPGCASGKGLVWVAVHASVCLSVYACGHGSMCCMGLVTGTAVYRWSMLLGSPTNGFGAGAGAGACVCVV